MKLGRFCLVDDDSFVACISVEFRLVGSSFATFTLIKTQQSNGNANLFNGIDSVCFVTARKYSDTLCTGEFKMFAFGFLSKTWLRRECVY